MSLFYVIDEVMDPHSGVLLLLASGELDYGAAPQLRRQLNAGLEHDRREVLLDLSMVTFIDSTAIGLIVSSAAALEEVGGALAIVCAEENTRVLRIFNIAGVDSLLELYYTREAALAGLSPVGWA
jgi:anti-sigma B factor antagonist